MAATFALICTQCGKQYPPDRPAGRQAAVHPRCDDCNEPLEVEIPTSGNIVPGEPLQQTILERYASFFPFEKIDRDLSLGEGFTPLVKAEHLAGQMGMQHLYFKNESTNPTWSFKDRGTITALQHALSLGYAAIGTVSTGNMAVSVAAYGVRAGLKTYILVGANMPPEKLNPILIHDPILIRVDGDYGNLYFESLAIGRKRAIYFMNSDVPFRVEGSKTIAFEICEQLNFQAPDYVVVPTSAGGNLRGIFKGFREFKNAGLIAGIPRIVCAQAAGCAPIYNAWNKGSEQIERIDNPQTMAHAIENPYPPSGNAVLRLLRENNGQAAAVSEEEIIDAQRELASEGIFGQPASAVPLAAVKQLRQNRTLTGNETVVCIVSGSGLKYTAALGKQTLSSFFCNISDLDGKIAEL